MDTDLRFFVSSSKLTDELLARNCETPGVESHVGLTTCRIGLMGTVQGVSVDKVSICNCESVPISGNVGQLALSRKGKKLPITSISSMERIRRYFYRVTFSQRKKSRVRASPAR